jgi:mannose-6-phosphate isomerase-like protein (cupin superfamily)
MGGIDLAEKLAGFSEYWAPRIVGRFNGHDIMLVKAKGEFVRHSHPDTDDFFLVLSGRLTIELPGGSVELGPGELFVVPRGVEHRPAAAEETHILLIEPAGTPQHRRPRHRGGQARDLKGQSRDCPLFPLFPRLLRRAEERLIQIKVIAATRGTRACRSRTVTRLSSRSRKIRPRSATA